MANTNTPPDSFPSKRQKMADQLQPVRSWYGLRGEIGVGDQLWHFVRVGGVPLPHPPLIHLIFGAGFPRKERLQLSFLHEFGHLQTFPFAFLHAAWLIFFRRKRGPRSSTFLKRIGLGIIAHQALWELSSELYALVKAGSEYRQIYHKYPNPLAQSLFWGGMTSLSVISNLWLRRWVGKKSVCAPAR